MNLGVAFLLMHTHLSQGFNIESYFVRVCEVERQNKISYNYKEILYKKP